MKKTNFGSNDIITIYKLMTRCGVQYEIDGHVALSHRDVMVKISSAKSKHPDKILKPHIVSYSRVNKEDVKKGKILLVVDDYKKLKPYTMPQSPEELIINMSNEQREEIRKRLIEEQEMNEGHNEIKPGYIKYLERKMKKRS